MTYRRLPSNLPAILRAAGLTVVEIEGWATRGRPASTGNFNPSGVLVHHTGGSSDSQSYVEWMAKEGRDDLPAPLCQLALSRKGVVYVVASGRANHAGKAQASGPMPSGDGNALYIGIEAMNTGSEGWTKAQYDAYVTLCATLCSKILNVPASHVRAHKETSLTGKWDPGKLDMLKFRLDIEEEMKPAPVPGVNKPTVLRVGSANIKSYPRMKIDLVEHDMKRLKGKADFWGLQEILPEDYKQELKEIFPLPDWQMRRLSSGESIVFNNKRFKWLYAPKNETVLHGPVKGICGKRGINYVWVWDKLSACRLVFGDVHFTPKQGTSLRAKKARDEGFANLRASIIAQKAHDNQHFIFAGDWNCSSKTIYQKLGREIGGMKVTVINTGWGPYGKPIDHIVLVGNFKIGARENLTGQYSDHRPVWVDITPV